MEDESRVGSLSFHGSVLLEYDSCKETGAVLAPRSLERDCVLRDGVHLEKEGVDLRNMAVHRHLFANQGTNVFTSPACTATLSLSLSFERACWTFVVLCME